MQEHRRDNIIVYKDTDKKYQQTFIWSLWKAFLIYEKHLFDLKPKA